MLFYGILEDEVQPINADSEKEALQELILRFGHNVKIVSEEEFEAIHKEKGLNILPEIK